jgi:alginate O-acetyltransferase complex protein AlgI
MIFLTYEFVGFALVFFSLYYLIPNPALRMALLVIGGLLFQFHYGGWVSVVPVLVLAGVTFLAGRIGGRRMVTGAIVVCVFTLVFYKYTAFIVIDSIGTLVPDFGSAFRNTVKSVLPAAIPLGLSFFTFEFVHYLTDVRRGDRPIMRLRDFLTFALFWPTMVAGPIKRYQQFLPALHEGLSRPSAQDATIGLTRIAIGLAKKWAADNLTGWIDYIEPQFLLQDRTWRWVFVAALAARILLDFSGYSDMAIGFARMMGIAVPENFNWPYLARSPIEFWQRWHISLSLWIRDYIYIPLGGSRLGLPRRVVNALTAMVLCGLWHGAAWNFAVWGLYHGVGLALAALMQGGISRLRTGRTGLIPQPASLGAAAVKAALTPPSFPARLLTAVIDIVCWAGTMVFVGIGWLLFFYPLEKAAHMTVRLFVQ